MGVLRVAKKAETEQQIRVLLEASKRIEKPFGFRVHHIANEDFYTDEDRAVKTLSAIFRESAQEQTGLPIDPNASFSNLIRSHEPFIERTQERDDRGPFIEEIGVQFRTSLGQDFSLFTRYIIDIQDDATLKGLIGPYVRDELETPLLQEQLKYFVTWHEQAHLTGCGEPQADLIGALMYRQAIADPTFLEIFADGRMIDNLFNHDKILEKYGWQTAEAMDYALGLDQDKVESLREDDFFEIACMEFETHRPKVALALYAIHELYVQNIGPLDEGISVSKTIPICAHLLKLDIFAQDSPERAFIERLHFALQRSANPSLYFDPAFSGKKPKPFHTIKSDVPEYLPLPSAPSPEQ